MVGICGSIGSENQSIEGLTDAICWLETDKTSEFVDDSLCVGYADHPIQFDRQPAETGDVLIWCWGDLLGHEFKGEYTPRSDEITDSEYCANLYEKYGMTFVAGLNSEFAGIIYDQNSGKISIFTDRLGSRPVYYISTSDGSTVFSSLLQSLAAHPEVDLKYQPDLLEEFVTYSRVFGVKTPIQGVESIPPASVVTFNQASERIETWRYWWPVPTSGNISFEELTDEFSKTVQKAVQERLEPQSDCGLLLSGGADSRLVLECMGSNTTGLHMNEYLEGNTEAQTAKRVAEEMSCDFSFLQRPIDYYPEVFKKSSKITNFNGLFNHSHALGFGDEIRNEVDVILSGHYADVMFGTVYLPSQFQNSELMRNLLPPQAENISSQTEFIRSLERMIYCDTPLYFNNALGISEILSEHITEDGKAIDHHGVRYPNIEAVKQFGMTFPITNGWGFSFYETTNQIVPTRYPMLDNRLIDIALKMPLTYRTCRDIVSASLENLNPNLAAIPHPDHGLPLSRHFYTRYYARKASRLISTIWGQEHKNSKLNPDGSSWPNHERLIRIHSFIENTLNTHEEQIRSSPYLDYDKCCEIYRDHIDGTNNRKELYILATLLGSSIGLCE